MLDEAERRRGAVLFKHAVKIQSAARVLAAHDALCRQRVSRQMARTAVLLQAAARRSMTQLKYIRMLGMARKAAAEAAKVVTEQNDTKKACSLQARIKEHGGLSAGTQTQPSAKKNQVDDPGKREHVSNLTLKPEYIEKEVAKCNNKNAIVSTNEGAKMNKDAWASLNDGIWLQCQVR